MNGKEAPFKHATTIEFLLTWGSRKSEDLKWFLPQIPYIQLKYISVTMSSVAIFPQILRDKKPKGFWSVIVGKLQHSSKLSITTSSPVTNTRILKETSSKARWVNRGEWPLIFNLRNSSHFTADSFFCSNPDQIHWFYAAHSALWQEILRVRDSKSRKGKGGEEEFQPKWVFASIWNYFVGDGDHSLLHVY